MIKRNIIFFIFGNIYAIIGIVAIVVLVTPNTSIYKIRGGECSPPLPSCYRCTHDIEMDFLSYISIEIEIISND